MLFFQGKKKTLLYSILKVTVLYIDYCADKAFYEQSKIVSTYIRKQTMEAMNVSLIFFQYSAHLT